MFNWIEVLSKKNDIHIGVHQKLVMFMYIFFIFVM
jgi:hypothetical protein